MPFEILIPLPRFLRPALGCFPVRPGYLLPHPLRCEKWRVRLQALGTGLKIGMTWWGLVTTNKRNPFYTGLADWAPLFALPGIVWVNLQYGECAAELVEAGQQWGVTIHTWADLDLLHDLEEVAALVAALDLVVAPANTVAQLAGSLGAPVWKCSIFADDWGGLGTEVHPWFPTMRLYRQSQPGDWQSVFARMTNDLRSWT